MKYQLVLQWPASSIDNYDTTIFCRLSLIKGPSDDDEVDGYDCRSSGQVNIFVLTDNPARAFESIKEDS